MFPAKVELTSEMSAWFTEPFIFGLLQEPPGPSWRSVASTICSESDFAAGAEGPWLNKLTRPTDVKEAFRLSSGRTSTPDSTQCFKSGFTSGAERPWLKKLTRPTDVEEASGWSSGTASTPDSTSCSESELVKEAEAPWLKKVKNVEWSPGLFSGIASTTDSTSCSESEFVTEAEAPWLKKVTQPKNVERPPGVSFGIASTPDSTSCSESEYVTGFTPLAPFAQNIASTSCASYSESESNNEGGEQLGNSQSVPSMVDKEFVQRLCNTVVKECSFLRISSTELRNEVSKRAKRHGSIATLRICVNGLPLTKRAKWLGPLLWSVSAILQRQGCPFKVQSNELYVPVNNGPTHVRIDLVAARL